MTTTVFNSRRQISDRTKYWVYTAIRFLCLFLFAYTAYAKIVDHQRFLNGLTKVHLINGYAELIAFLVPALELLIVGLLTIPGIFKTGLLAFIGLMSAFTCYIIGAMIWEPHLPCHCGGAIEKLSWMQHVWFNLAFIVLAIIAVRLSKFSNY